MATTILSILIDGVEQLKKTVKNDEVAKKTITSASGCQSCKKHKEYYNKIREFKQQRIKERNNEL